MSETLPIPGYEGWYEVDREGNVFSICRKNRILRKNYIAYSRKHTPYKRVRLQKNGISQHKLVHRIVAETFIPNPNNLSQVNHKDKNSLNNHADNLEWCTGQENVEHSQGKVRSFLNPEGEVVTGTLSSIAREYGLSVGNLGGVYSGVRKQHKGWTAFNECIGS
jgi:hypothetical protein